MNYKEEDDRRESVVPLNIEYNPSNRELTCTFVKAFHIIKIMVSSAISSRFIHFSFRIHSSFCHDPSIISAISKPYKVYTGTESGGVVQIGVSFRIKCMFPCHHREIERRCAQTKCTKQRGTFYRASGW